MNANKNVTREVPLFMFLDLNKRRLKRKRQASLCAYADTKLNSQRSLLSAFSLVASHLAVFFSSPSAPCVLMLAGDLRRG